MTSEVFNTDCLEYMRTLPDKAFQLAIADPPYGINIAGRGLYKGDFTKCAHRHVFADKDWDMKAPDKEWFDELLRISENQIIWGANHFISRIPYDSPCWIVWDRSEQTYLKQNVIMKPPTIIDTDRTRRGDWMKKPTAYWFWNCEPTHGKSFQQTPKSQQRRHMEMKKAPHAGLCSEERSTISPDYARNFICDFIIGKEQAHTERTLFDL